MEKVYFDTETTGLDANAEIIQVGIVDVNGVVLFDSLVQCQGEIPEQASKIHGITKDDLINAPTWPEIHAQVCRMLANAEVVKIYNASYDLRLLRQTATRHDLEVPKLRARCVMKAYGNLYFDGEWIKLTEACHYEKIDTSGLPAHNAVADCQMTRLLDAAIDKEKLRRQRRAEYREKINRQKTALIPKNAHEYPDFGQGYRPEGYKTFSQLNKRDLKSFEFAGRCCDTYGNRGYLFKPTEKQQQETVMLKAHEKRVVEERDSLSEKVEKLCNFLGTELYKSLPVDDQDLLDEQYQYMFGYLKTLDKRIAKLTN